MPACANCGETVEVTARFCLKCGAAIVQPAPAAPVVPSVAPGYPVPPGYPYYLPPPKRNNVVWIVVLVVILVITVPTVLAALLYVMVSGLIGSPSPAKPVLTFATPSPAGIGERIPVASTSQAVGPANYRVNLAAGSPIGTAVAMPTTGGGFVVLTVGSAFYRVNWTDVGGEQMVNGGDTFVITHVTSGAGTTYLTLPAATQFTFYLLWSDGSQITSVVWVAL